MRYHVIRPWEGELFRQCRRAWDLSARERQNYEPASPTRVFDFDRAVVDAMDVYYFPGMWDWNRAIVRPLAVQAFAKSMRQQRAAYTERREITLEQEQDWQQRLEQGTQMLQRYFSWAPQADLFDSLQVALLFDITIPDPSKDGASEDGLLTPDGLGILFRVRINTVVMDEHERCWLVEHRVVDGWSDLDQLLLDEQSATRAWAWQRDTLGTLEGTIHNELRVPAAGEELGPADAMEIRALQGSGGLIKQEFNEHIRRTHIPRSQTELANRGLSVAHQVRDMTGPRLALYPNPTLDGCGSCDYRQPCLAMSDGGDPTTILATSFRRRTTADHEAGRLGATWGFMPDTPRIADYRRPARDDGGEAATG